MEERYSISSEAKENIIVGVISDHKTCQTIVIKRDWETNVLKLLLKLTSIAIAFQLIFWSKDTDG